LEICKHSQKEKGGGGGGRKKKRRESDGSLSFINPQFSPPPKKKPNNWLGYTLMVLSPFVF